MPHQLDIDLKAQVECSLRLTLEYIITHAHLRELFSIQEMLSRHAADAAWHMSQHALSEIPKDYQEMPEALRQQVAEMERQKRMQQTMANYTSAQHRQES